MELRKRKLELDAETKTNKKLTTPAITTNTNVSPIKESILLTENNSAKKPWAIQDYLLDSEWKCLLNTEFEKDYFIDLNKILEKDYRIKKIQPIESLVFNAFNSTPLNKIKCVILGQDPYHDDDQAHGLAFSVPESILKLPPSLKNIFAELERDIPGFKRDESLGGCLQNWTTQGIFLLNSFLTVEAHKPGSHSKIGWQTFTDKVIQLISEKTTNCVFILWGNFAHKKESLIDTCKHKVIKSAHPSPLSLQKFVNSKCFSQANSYLKLMGREEINWSLKK